MLHLSLNFQFFHSLIYLGYRLAAQSDARRTWQILTLNSQYQLMSFRKNNNNNNNNKIILISTPLIFGFCKFVPPYYFFDNFFWLSCFDKFLLEFGGGGRVLYRLYEHFVNLLLLRYKFIRKKLIFIITYFLSYINFFQYFKC